jgi:DNA-binding NtrC family response regulator
MTNANTKILIVDDDPSALESLSLVTSKFFNNIKQFSTVEDSINYLTENSVDLIISDYNLGLNKLSGLDFYNHCQKLKPNTPFILISGRADEVQFEVIEGGVSHPRHMISKPFKIKDLTSIIDDLMKKCA